MPGTKITVNWPIGVDTSDPNGHYRPTLESMVGKQLIDWDWEVGSPTMDTLRIKIRKPKDSIASYLAMKWN